MADLSSLGEIGSTPPVDVFPFTKYLPEGLWRNWRTRTHRLRDKVNQLYGSLVDQAMERRKTVGVLDNFVDRVCDNESLSRHELAIMCGNLLEGGTDTMATTTLVLFQAMAQNPTIQEEAQKEIDSVIGSSRAPTWADFDKLPSVTKIVKELLRWRPPAPSAFPHTITKGLKDTPRPEMGSISRRQNGADGLYRRCHRRHEDSSQIHRHCQPLGITPRPRALRPARGFQAVTFRR